MSSKTKRGKLTGKSKEIRKFDDKLSQELVEVIESITHSGKKVIEREEFKKITNICKRSDKYVKEVYVELAEHLKKEHAEVRLSAFQLCDELFRRSHCFREQVVLNLEEIVKLTTKDGLPPPQKTARLLRQSALKSIHEWNSTFGHAYKKLAIGYKYLKEVEKVDFNALEIVDNATIARQQENQRRLEAINAVRIKKVLAEIKEKELDIKTTALSLSNSINLLLPHPDDFFIPSDDEAGSGTESVLPTKQLHDGNSDSESEEGMSTAAFREVGMANVHHSLQVEFTPCAEACIEETPENVVIIENVREYARVINNKYLPYVKAWLEVLSKSSGHKEDQKRLVKLKGELDDLMFKYDRMRFVSANEVSSDSELEEVSELQESKPITDATGSGDPTEWSILSVDGIEGDPASVQAKPSCIKKETLENPQPSTSSQSELVSDRKKKLLAVAPKLPFDVDLYHWEDDKLPVPTMIPSSTDGHRFWVGTEGAIDELPVPEGAASLRTRVIEFTGNFSPVTHCCRVRLPSGKLCPRRDRIKCPFHGEIVPRDESGECINPKDAMRIQEQIEKRQQEKPDWQDPKLLAEIKKSTGIDLKMPEKGKRKKRKREFPGLTDLKKSEDTATKRLERKIFKKSVLKKVAKSLDRLDHRKFHDKFGDQFNYLYSS